jgi:Protein of unknown function (DUF3024)
MPSPDLKDALVAVEKFCDSRVPAEYREEMRVEFDRRGNSITIVERRPPWKPEAATSDWSSMKVAQLRYEPETARWSLYCRDSNERWWPYDGIGPTSSVDPLLTEVDADPTGIFWG